MENYFSANRKFLYTLGIITFLVFGYYVFLSPPSNFTPGVIIDIPEGASLRSVSLELKQDHIIRSRTVFEAFVILFGGEKHIISTDYFFESKLPVYEIARRISKGEHHMAPVVVTIPEGFDNTHIADTAAALLINFNKSQFLLETQSKEGYLFPDTYFFLTTDTEKEVIASMSQNFNKKIAPLLSAIVSSGKTENQIITMASIIEGEADGDADRGFISGILWKRISIGMPLEVDSAPETYKTKGLPKNPINNPGLAAIEAAIHPQKSPYLYYLHDKNGTIHYASTLAEQDKNIATYLR